MLVLGAIGIVQDTLIWLFVSLLSTSMQFGIHVGDFLTALLGGVITRASVLVLLPLGPQPAEEAA